MIDSILMTLVAGSSAQAANLLMKAFREYLKKKGQPLSESPTEDEVVKALTSLEAQEPSEVTVAEAQSAFEDAVSRLGTFRAERERQARNSYNLAWAVLGAGSAIVLVGIVWMGLGASITPGTVTSIVGAITSLCSGAIFKFANDANDRLDDIADNLHRIESTRMSLEVVQKISNDDERNAAIKQIVDRLSHTQAATVRRQASKRGKIKKAA